MLLYIFSFLFRFNMLDLNFDCLLKIVSYLNIIDMINLKTVFREENVLNDVIDYKESRITHFDMGLLNNKKYKVKLTVLQSIGLNLTSLDFKCTLTLTSPMYLNLILRYCSNIKTLHFDLSALDKPIKVSCLDRLQAFLKNLPHLIHLNIKAIDQKHLNSSLESLVNLRTLRISKIAIDEQVMHGVAYHNKNLSTLYTAIKCRESRNFIPFFHNPLIYNNLRELCLHISPDYELTSEDDIIQHLPHLEKITFKSVDSYETGIYYNICKFLKCMASVDTLRYFCVDEISLPKDAYRILSKFKKLQVLKNTTNDIYNNIDDEILEFIGGYKELTELHIVQSAKFSYETLERIIKTHPKLKLLDISHSKLFYRNGNIPFDTPKTNAAYFDESGPNGDTTETHWAYFCESLKEIRSDRKDVIKIIYVDFYSFDEDEITFTVNFK